MVRRTSPFSDIIVNGFPVHRVILAEKSKTFKDLIESLNDDVKELNLPYDNELVDRLLNLIYYEEYKLDIELYELIQYMNIDMFDEFNGDIFKNSTPDDIRKITEKYDLDVKFNPENPTDSDYMFLCCLPHEKYMKIMEAQTKDIFKLSYKSNPNSIVHILYVANNLRCCLESYSPYHWIYCMYNHAISSCAGALVSGHYLNAELTHNGALKGDVILFALIGEKRSNKSNALTRRCINILISLGHSSELLIPIRDAIPN